MPVPSPLRPFIDPLEKLGFPYCVPPDETLFAETMRSTQGMFNLIHHQSQFKADIYVAAADPLHHWALKNRRRVDLGDEGIWIAPPEYVILRKMEYLREGHSEKHVRDVRFMLAVTDINQEFVDREVLERGLGPQWERCRK